MPTIDPNKLQLYVQEGEQLIALGKATFDQLRALFAGSATDAADDAALAKLDALYAARIEQAKADAGGDQ